MLVSESVYAFLWKVSMSRRCTRANIRCSFVSRCSLYRRFSSRAIWRRNFVHFPPERIFALLNLIKAHFHEENQFEKRPTPQPVFLMKRLMDCPYDLLDANTSVPTVKLTPPNEPPRNLPPRSSEAFVNKSTHIFCHLSDYKSNVFPSPLKQATPAHIHIAVQFFTSWASLYFSQYLFFVSLPP